MGRRILITGLGTFWGGRLAQALELEPDIEVIIGLDTEEPLPAARVTPEVLETVIETLVDNSRQAGAGRVDIYARPARPGIALRIADDGCGIAEADRERIFEPFFTGRRAAGGTGLGLSIARSLLAATGGRIAPEPAAKGAVFTLWLPEAS